MNSQDGRDADRGARRTIIEFDGDRKSVDLVRLVVIEGRYDRCRAPNHASTIPEAEQTLQRDGVTWETVVFPLVKRLFNHGNGTISIATTYGETCFTTRNSIIFHGGVFHACTNSK